MTSAPWVTSGSSPPSLITPAAAVPSSYTQAIDGDVEVEAQRRRHGDDLGPLVAIEQEPTRRLRGRRGAGAGGVALAHPAAGCGARHVPGRGRGRSAGRSVPIMAIASPPARASKRIDRRRRDGRASLAAQAREERHAGLLDEPPLRLLHAHEPDRDSYEAGAGRQPSSSTRRRASINAVGAFPTATTAPSPAFAGRPDLIPGGRASQVPEDVGQILRREDRRARQIVSTPRGSARSRRTPDRSISTSDHDRPSPRSKRRDRRSQSPSGCIGTTWAKSKSAEAWIIRADHGANRGIGG